MKYTYFFAISLLKKNREFASLNKEIFWKNKEIKVGLWKAQYRVSANSNPGLSTTLTLRPLAMCGQIPVGKGYLKVVKERVGAAICSAN